MPRWTMIIKSSVLLVSKLNVLLSSSRFLHSEKKNETRKLFTCKVNYLNFYLTRVGGSGGRARGRQRSNATFQWAVNGRNTKGFLHLLLRSSTAAAVLRHHEEDVDYEMMMLLPFSPAFVASREPLFLFFGLETFLSYMSGLEKKPEQVRLGVSPSCHHQKRDPSCIDVMKVALCCSPDA